jgi:hypothetical protein
MPDFLFDWKEDWFGPVFTGLNIHRLPPIQFNYGESTS